MIIDKEKDYADIMEVIDSMEGHKFESFCATLLTHNGYRDVKVTQGSNDYGIDITARYHNNIYGIQCKRHKAPIGIAAVREALGGYDYYNCDIVAVLTNNTFSPNAINQAQISGVKLWDRKTLIDFIDNCDSLDFVKDFHMEDGAISKKASFQYSPKYIYTNSITTPKVKNYTIQNGGIYISNKKCSRTLVNIFRLFCLVSGIVVCGLSLLIMLVSPLLGIGGFLFGVFYIIYSRKLKKVIKLYDSKREKEQI